MCPNWPDVRPQPNADLLRVCSLTQKTKEGHLLKTLALHIYFLFGSSRIGQLEERIGPGPSQTEVPCSQLLGCSKTDSSTDGKKAWLGGFWGEGKGVRKRGQGYGGERMKMRREERG